MFLSTELPPTDAEPKTPRFLCQPMPNATAAAGRGSNASTKTMQMETEPVTAFTYGYVSPVVVLLTVVTNTLICIVLLQKHMRSPTNLLLVAMAISDMLTGLFPVPIFFYFYTLGHYHDYIPYDWCYVNPALTTHLPTICHTASIWLTCALSIQRYVCVCHSLVAKTLCTIQNTIKVIVVVYVAAFVSQTTRLFEFTYSPQETLSLVDPTGQRTVTGCSKHLVKFLEDHMDVVYMSYWWFRVVFIHLVPCASLVFINALLFHAMRQAKARRDLLLRQNRRSESRRLAESNLATLMLLAVVGVFLLVEFPLAVLMITLIYENTFYCYLMTTHERLLAALFINQFILFSYPVNFFIYCGMSRQFRQTFRSLFSSSSPASTPHCQGQGNTSAWQSIELQSKTYNTNH